MNELEVSEGVAQAKDYAAKLNIEVHTRPMVGRYIISIWNSAKKDWQKFSFS